MFWTSLGMSIRTGPGRPVLAMWNASFTIRAMSLGVLHQVMVLGDGPADLDDRRFLERVGADDVRGHLAGDGDERQRVHLGVGQAGDEVERPGPGGRHHDARLAGGAGVALGREDPPLLVPRQDRADPVAVARQRLVHRHARPAGIGEDDLDAVPHQRLDQNVGPGGRSRGDLGLAIVDGGHGDPRFPSRRLTHFGSHFEPFILGPDPGEHNPTARRPTHGAAPRTARGGVEKGT